MGDKRILVAERTAERKNPELWKNIKFLLLKKQGSLSPRGTTLASSTSALGQVTIRASSPAVPDIPQTWL